MKQTISILQLPPLEKVNLSEVVLNGGVSIFFPAYNEEDNIEKAVRKAVEVLSSFTENYEVLVVDDKSTDRTGEIAEALHRENPNVRVIHHEHNTRLGGAMRTGFFRSSKSIVFYCDADNPVDLWDVKRALPLMSQFDLVTGYRLNREERLIRKIYSKVYNFIIASLFGFKVTDINFSFKMVKRHVLNQIELRSNGGFIDAEFIDQVLGQGFKMAQVGVMYYPRTAGVSTMASIPVIFEIIREMRQYWLEKRKKS
jgi:glycosyltransferase involved in cell wall biosynthesis